MRNQKKAGVISALKAAVRPHRILTIGTLLCVAASVAASLIPPLLLKNIIDRLTGGMPLLFTAVLLYFGSLVLEGTLSSAQETLLVLFGQKMTHALRSEMSQKLIVLPASTLVGQNPGEVAARFSGDVDAVEALFTSGIISMAADACRIISILAVIAVENMGLALVLLVIYAFATGIITYNSSRIDIWLDPFNEEWMRDKGYQIRQSLLSIGSGGLFGLGLGKSRQKFLFLPEEHNDFIFAIICEELGLVGATIIMVMFALLIIRGYWIALHARDRFGSLLAVGVTTQIALQVFLNIAVVTNLIPNTGISLPFFSYGGTALAVQLAEVGIVLSVSRQMR